jgi:hypothetical protein
MNHFVEGLQTPAWICKGYSPVRWGQPSTKACAGGVSLGCVRGVGQSPCIDQKPGQWRSLWPVPRALSGALRCWQPVAKAGASGLCRSNGWGLSIWPEPGQLAWGCGPWARESLGASPRPPASHLELSTRCPLTPAFLTPV